MYLAEVPGAGIKEGRHKPMKPREKEIWLFLNWTAEIASIAWS